MRRFAYGMMMLLVVAWWSGGCDRKPSAAPADNATPPPAPVAARPTTQQLLSAPKVQIKLLTAPMSLETPDSWKIDSAGVVQGPAPLGDVQITISRFGTFEQKRIAMTIDGLKAKYANDHSQPWISDLQTINGLSAFESFRSPEAGQLPGLVATTLPTRPVESSAGESRDVDWMFTFFLPRGDDTFGLYKVRLEGLTVGSFRADEAFCRKIVQSIRYDPTAGQP